MTPSNQPIVEICCYSVLSCQRAEQAGAHRIELCAGLSDGGITPSLGLIEQAKEAVSIPLFIMIRPRGGDFLYSDSELKTMISDIHWARKMGADGLVFGCLTPHGKLDEIRNKQLLDAANGLPVTLHRAFDMCENPFIALETATQLGFNRILTSGQQRTAELGLELLQQLTERADSNIQIMAGSGVSAQNIPLFLQAGMREFHLSAQKIEKEGMLFKQNNVSMATTNRADEYARYEANYDLIKAAVRAAIIQK
ncbi:MAG: copper homeostasis protein CutC [Spirosomataceae bacterium]